MITPQNVSQKGSQSLTDVLQHPVDILPDLKSVTTTNQQPITNNVDTRDPTGSKK